MTAVIFSHQRCGSSNLIHFLVAAYGLSLSEPDYYEPLNLRRMGERDIAWQDGDNRFDAYCAKVMQATPVLKHIYGQLPPRLDRHVAAQSSGVIFLFRKNLKLAALSSAIARRSNTWQARPEQPLGRIEPDDSGAQEHLLALETLLDAGLPCFEPLYQYSRGGDASLFDARSKDHGAGTGTRVLVEILQTW
jgi:hypothetical protein